MMNQDIDIAACGSSEGRDADCEILYVRPEVVVAVQAQMPTAVAIQDLAETFKLLGDPTRLRIVIALSHGELCVCDLAEMLGSTRTAVSNHLRLLRGMRLVRHRREGKLAFYSLADGSIATLIAAGQAHLASPVRA
jgi:DNA-binding transcriptional ArsR family regulator